MTQDVQQKLVDGEALTLDEQKVLMQQMLSNVAQLKENNPEKYLELLTALNTTLSDLNSGLTTAIEEFQTVTP